MTARVLVVDDSLTTQEMVGMHLRKAGYTVKNASDGAEAVEMAKQWSPSLILLDVMMPVMNGYSAVRQIREFSSTPIIMLSAMGSEDNKIQGLNAGADDYIVKPFSSQELMARTRALLRRSKSHRKNEVHHKIFQHGDLLIDVERGLVKVAGEGINITETEFKLIVVLADAMGEMVTLRIATDSNVKRFLADIVFSSARACRSSLSACRVSTVSRGSSAWARAPRSRRPKRIMKASSGFATSCTPGCAKRGATMPC